MSEQERTSAHSYGSVERPPFEQPARKCCKIKYKTRRFYSKGAFLVLLWTTLGSTAISQFDNTFRDDTIHDRTDLSILFWILVSVAIFISVPVIGWLQDAKLGNYRVFRAGSVVLFLVTTVGRIGLIIMSLLPQRLPDSVIELYTAVYNYMGMVGVATCLVTALQLGLDQMPDGSAANITSFIAWYAFSLCAGLWVGMLPYTLHSCDNQDSSADTALSFIPPICMTVVCCSMFLLTPRYLIVEPKSPRSLKTIYRVLKFAAKHKAPLNHSALTYWEEDLPSRLDLGKSKYGGPFTTEQVENVKTFFRLLLTLIPISIIALALSTTHGYVIDAPPLDNNCLSILISTFTSNWWWCGMVTTVLYELVLFPLVRNKVPNTLRRIGIASLLIFIIESIYLAETVIEDSASQDANYTTGFPIPPQYELIKSWANVAFTFLYASIATLLYNGILEFVCAQSPYNMRGLLTGCTVFSIACSVSIGRIAIKEIHKFTGSTTDIVCHSILTALGLCGLILHCTLARWYKRRVRDEDYSEHRVVEEVYDRHLSHFR